MLKKHKDIEHPERKSRKDCLIQRGKDTFHFDKEEEFLKYKYLCCCDLKRREWKKCCNECMPYSYFQWKESIRQKYMMYDAEQLEEFRRYLVLGIRDREVFREANNIIFAAFVSSAFASLMGNIIMQLVGKVANAENSIELLMIKTVFIVAILFVVLAMLAVIYFTVVPIHKNNLEQNMFRDYKEIIELLIKEKNNE